LSCSPKSWRISSLKLVRYFGRADRFDVPLKPGGAAFTPSTLAPTGELFAAWNMGEPSGDWPL
jgi:hypothetical protein